MVNIQFVYSSGADNLHAYILCADLLLLPLYSLAPDESRGGLETCSASFVRCNKRMRPVVCMMVLGRYSFLTTWS